MLPTLLLLAALATPAAAEQARATPTLLVGHLRVAAQACLEAFNRIPGGEGATPDGSPRWASEQLDRVTANLQAATKDTVDPREQERLARLTAEASSIRADLRRRSGSAGQRITRLRADIRRFADEVQRRIDLLEPDPVPIVRPTLGS